ncbi:MAG: hypothetical protein EBS53_17270 [Bacteroidetes bacterium]|nr:hypothetical protein [Bacteroidota bacterium]
MIPGDLHSRKHLQPIDSERPLTLFSNGFEINRETLRGQGSFQNARSHSQNRASIAPMIGDGDAVKTSPPVKIDNFTDRVASVAEIRVNMEVTQQHTNPFSTGMSLIAVSF